MDANGDLILDIRNKWLKNPRCQEPFQNRSNLKCAAVGSKGRSFEVKLGDHVLNLSA